MPHQLRTWGLSAGVAAALIAPSLWRSPPERAGQWALLGGVWVLGTVVLHLLLHNRWMDDLDLRSRRRLAAWRRARAAGASGPAVGEHAPEAAGPAAQPAEVSEAEAPPREASRPRRRGAGHATHRSLRAPWQRGGPRASGGRYDRRGRSLRTERR